MEHRIVTKPAFKLIGYELRTSSEEGRNQREIPAFWSRYMEQQGYRRIPNAIYKESPVELGICTDFDMESCSFSYIIGTEVEHFGGAPEDLVCREFPEAIYAVFTTPLVRHEEFPASIQSTWMAIFGEWFPHSGFEHAGAGAAEFERYDERCHRDKFELIQMDIYVPVRKKD